MNKDKVKKYKIYVFKHFERNKQNIMDDESLFSIDLILINYLLVMYSKLSELIASSNDTIIIWGVMGEVKFPGISVPSDEHQQSGRWHWLLLQGNAAFVSSWESLKGILNVFLSIYFAK